MSQTVHFKHWFNFGVDADGHAIEVEAEVTVRLEGSRSEGYDLQEIWVYGVDKETEAKCVGMLWDSASETLAKAIDETWSN